MSQQAKRESGALPKTRLEAFSDGVIAIIVTILVLEIKVPRLQAGTDLNTQLQGAMAHAAPLVLAYALSFVVLLVFWVAHHHLLHAMRHADRRFLWLNGLFLMILAFVPVPTALMGEYPSARSGTVLYGVVLALAGLAFLAMRLHATRHGDLLHATATGEPADRALRRSWLSPALYGLGAAMAFIDVRLAWLVYILVPVIYIVPSAFERAGGRVT